MPIEILPLTRLSPARFQDTEDEEVPGAGYGDEEEELFDPGSGDSDDLGEDDDMDLGEVEEEELPEVE